jgi:PTH1 family peptidyl-tRNA hydrolase
MLADAVVERWGMPGFRRGWRWRARITEDMVGDQSVVVVKPQTYMNRSGQALGQLLKAEDFEPSRDLLILVDDVALPLGTSRIRARGSAGGHNGLQSIAGRLQSEHYARLRIGVGPRPPDEEQSDFVLSDFTDEEHRTITNMMPRLTEAVECWLKEGVETAMNRFNTRGMQSE